MIETPLTIDEQIATAAQLLVHPAGSGAIYEVLEQLARRHDLSDVWLVLHPRTTGTQVFRRARWSAPAEVVAELVLREPGVYSDPPVDLTLSRAIAALCDASFRAAAAEAQSAQEPTSGLAGRHVIDHALAGAAARGARYGWAATAVLLGTDGEAPPAHRWRALSAGLRAAMRTGDEAGVEAPGLALAILPDAGPDAVRPFVARVRAAMNAAGGEGIDLLAATATTPAETVDPAELRRLTRERFAALVDRVTDAVGDGPPPGPGSTSAPARTTPPEPDGTPAAEGGVDPADMWDLEVELCTVPGVVSVGAAPRLAADGGGLVVTVVAAEVGEELHGSVTELVHAYAPGASVHLISMRASARGAVAARADRGEVTKPVERQSSDGGGPYREAASLGTNGNGNGAADLPARGQDAPGGPARGPSAPPLRSTTAPGDAWSEGGSPTRVTLVRAAFDPLRGMSEVALALGRSRGTGRAPAGPLAGGAQATLTALAALGIEVPFYLVSAERARGVPGEPVVVVLAPRQAAAGAGSAERMGVAGGDDDVETASRATLGALNRHLAHSVVTR